MTTVHLVASVLALGVATGLSAAQSVETKVDVIHTFSGKSNLGARVKAMADINGDGVPELLIANQKLNSNTGSVFVHSGKTGALIYELKGLVAGGLMGGDMADAGDVDGDGVHDIIAGAEGPSPGTAGRVHIFSGKTGELIRTIEGQNPWDKFGYTVAGAGDLDGDGRAEVIVGATRYDGIGEQSGRAYIFRGSDGSVLRTFDGDWKGQFLGIGLANGGDIDGDGVSDQLVGRRGDFINSGPSVFAFSGATGALIYEAAASPFGNDEGFDGPWVPLNPVGDLDGDGITDFAAGHEVRSGADWSILLPLEQPLDCGGNCLKKRAAAAGDVNHDGVPDIILGVPGASAAIVYSGADGSVLRMMKPDCLPFFGTDVAGIGDVNGDGEPDFLIGGNGVAWVISGVPGEACPADCDLSCTLDLFDFLCYANQFNTGNPAADLNGDGKLDLFDFLAFTNLFNAGC